MFEEYFLLCFFNILITVVIYHVQTHTNIYQTYASDKFKYEHAICWAFQLPEKEWFPMDSLGPMFRFNPYKCVIILMRTPVRQQKRQGELEGLQYFPIIDKMVNQ